MENPKALSLIVIYGTAGAGKSTRAELLHKELSNTAHIGVDHIKRFISEFREVASHQDVSLKIINAMAREYLRNNISVIVEQGMSASEIEVLEKIAQECEAKFFVYRLDASREILAARVEERTNRLNKPIISQEHIDTMYKTHVENNYPSTRVFDSGKVEAAEFVDVVLRDLGIL